ncbi:MAG TPA: helix-turn-helix transcriptional regulator [Ktedonobacterales bacterium]|nr:helix-turn-helix transcriptional regulator [Ktedonobacterales bacterium]
MTDLQQTIGATLRRLRQERQLTIKELAERAIVSVVYLGEIERGKKYPSALVLERLASALDLTLPDLLESVADDLRGVRQPVMAIGFALPTHSGHVEQPQPQSGTGGRILNLLVA